jgi:hypothetical protein
MGSRKTSEKSVRNSVPMPVRTAFRSALALDRGAIPTNAIASSRFKTPVVSLARKGLRFVGAVREEAKPDTATTAGAQYTVTQQPKSEPMMAFADSWIAAWNRRDVEAVLASFPNVAPKSPQRSG